MSRAWQLADQLVAAGKLRSAAWWDAVCAVPRHEFVPEVFRQERAYEAAWHRLDTATEQGRQLDPRTPWESLIGWFLASFELGADISLGYCRSADGKPTATSSTVGDGSWAECPRRVWRTIESAHALWSTLGHPAWNRFGLTVIEDHQFVWLDTPPSSHTWPLPLSTQPG